MRVMIDRLLEVPSIDPDDARRRKLLNILLAGMMGLTMVALVWTVYENLTGRTVEGETPLYPVIIVLLVGLAIIFMINRLGAGWLASSIFLLLLALALFFADEPQEVIAGRSTFMLAVPILMASILLRPYTSFVMAVLISLMHTVIAQDADIVPNMFTMIGFFAMAIVSWLSARGLERALGDLRAVNRELDQRVEDRTRDLAEALGKNQAILQDIADGVIVFNNVGQAIVANPAISHLIKQPAQEIIGFDLKTLMGKEVDADDQERVINLMRDQEIYGPSVRLDWGEKTFSVSMATVRAAPDEVTGTVAVFHDFTQEAEIERMKETFVSMISHDLRTPLSAIQGYTDMLQQSVYGPLSEKQTGVMTRINANTARLLSMVNNLLDRAQLEAGKLTLQIQPFDSRELIADLDAVMSVLAQNQGLELTCHINDDVPATLSGDRRRLHRILVNLVGNAIKFTEQGEVNVRIYRPDADHWAADVSDTGPGIPDKAQPYIFEPFEQVDGSITRKHSGVGLGLTIVKQLTTLMGGQVELTSKLGHGSTFSITLPLVPPIQEEAS